MAIMVDVLEKHENINYGETIKDTSEMVTVTIALGEYRSLVAENEMYKCENARLKEITDQAIEEKETIKRQWETQQKLWESALEKRSEPAPQQTIKHTLTSNIKKTGGEQVDR